MSIRSAIIWLGLAGIVFVPAAGADYLITAPERVEAGPIVAGEDRLVTFRFQSDLPASHVYVAGSFNGWAQDALPMAGPDRGGSYRISTPIAPGEYRYKFVADGIWYLDPETKDTDPESANLGSLLIVDDRWPAVEKGVTTPGTIRDEDMLLDDESVSMTRPNPERVAVAARAHRGDLTGMSIVLRSGDTESLYPMSSAGHDRRWEYFRGEIVAGLDMEGRIGLLLEDGGTNRFLTRRGVEESAAAGALLEIGPVTLPLFEVPAWGEGAVWYRIETEWFLDGDTDNNPELGAKGDFRGVAERLGYLRTLGVEVVSLTIARKGTESHERRRPDPAFGGEEAFSELIAKAHEEQMRVVVHMEVVEGDREGEADSLLGSARYWIGEAGADGLLIDTPGRYGDSRYFRRFRENVKQLNNEALLIGNPGAKTASRPRPPMFDGALAEIGFSRPFRMFLVEESVDAARLDELIHAGRGILAENFLLTSPTPLGEPLETIEAEFDPRKLALAVTMAATFPGAPMIRAGEEIAFQPAVDDADKKQFPWETADRLAAIALREAIAAPLAIRQSHPALRHGTFTTIHAEDRLYAFRRTSAMDDLLVLIHAGSESATVDIERSVLPSLGEDVPTELLHAIRVNATDSAVRIKMEPYSAAILDLRPES